MRRRAVVASITHLLIGPFTWAKQSSNTRASVVANSSETMEFGCSEAGGCGEEGDLGRVAAGREEDELVAVPFLVCLEEGLDAVGVLGGRGDHALDGVFAQPGVVGAQVRLDVGLCVGAQAEVPQGQGPWLTVTAGLLPRVVEVGDIRAELRRPGAALGPAVAVLRRTLEGCLDVSADEQGWSF